MTDIIFEKAQIQTRHAGFWIRALALAVDGTIIY